MLIIVTSDHKSSHFTQVQQRSLSCESDCEAIDRLEEDKLSCRLELWVRIPISCGLFSITVDWEMEESLWSRWLNRVNPKVKNRTAPEPWVWSYTKKREFFKKKPPKKRRYISIQWGMKLRKPSILVVN